MIHGAPHTRMTRSSIGCIHKRNRGNRDRTHNSEKRGHVLFSPETALPPLPQGPVEPSHQGIGSDTRKISKNLQKSPRICPNLQESGPSFLTRTTILPIMPIQVVAPYWNSYQSVLEFLSVTGSVFKRIVVLLD